MEKANHITIEQCCVVYNIERSFVQKLDEHGLIELIRTDETVFIAFEQLADLEKYTHLYYELEINLEGLETIKHLLDRVHALQQEVNRLKGEAG
ncbi:chaperone modulator CbpM [Fluviicola sp.]|uniref:chaperone modulator CbpM n=1 Tax=Fluviicola sp. TaxID=1917219 RepID=UPI0031D16E0C